MRSVGISTCIFGERFEPADHLPLVAAAGFTAIELSIYRGNRFDWQNPAAVRALRRLCADMGIVVWSIHSPGDGPLGLLDDQQRQSNVDILCRTLDLADELGADCIVSHGLLFGDFARDRENTVRSMSESVRQLLPRVRASRASLAFENDTVGADQPWRARDVLALVRNFNEPKQIGFALDTGHAHISADLPELCGALGPELISLHLNDNDGQRDIHQPPGDGSIDWTAVWAALRRIGYDGCAMYEISDYGGSRSPKQLLAATMNHHRRMLSPVQSATDAAHSGERIP